MNHGLKLHPDGTLEITMPKGKKVTRVLVCKAGTQNGSLYYPEEPTVAENATVQGGANDLISRQEFLRGFEEMCSCTDYGWDERDFRDLIKKAPSAESDKNAPKTFKEQMNLECVFCRCHERGDTLYELSDWDGGISFDCIRDIKYCPICGRGLLDE